MAGTLAKRIYPIDSSRVCPIVSALVPECTTPVPREAPIFRLYCSPVNRSNASTPPGKGNTREEQPLSIITYGYGMSAKLFTELGMKKCDLLFPVATDKMLSGNLLTEEVP
jgi:hypothetical protein